MHKGRERLRYPTEVFIEIRFVFTCFLVTKVDEGARPAEACKTHVAWMQEDLVGQVIRRHQVTDVHHGEVLIS